MTTIDNSSDQTNYWDGAISDLRVWNRSLSALEIAAAIDDSASLSGYEANLVAWYALSGDANNQATSNWNLGRDYDPRSSAAAQSVWDLGVMDITSADVFTAVNGLKSFDQDGTGARQCSNGELITMYAAGEAYSDWGRVSFLPNTSSSYSDGSATYRPVVGFTPGSTYPAVAGIHRPVAGVYGVDARFWKPGQRPAPPSSCSKLPWRCHH